MARTASALILLVALAGPAEAGPQKGDAEQARRAARAATLADELKAGGEGARAAATELRRLGEAAHPALLAALPSLRPAEAALALRTLSFNPTPAVRDALVRAAGSRHLELRRAAGENACMFPGDEKVADALITMLRDEDTETVELAQGALLRGRFPSVFPQLLDAAVYELGQETPRASWVNAYRRTVEETLLRNPGRVDLVHAHLAACARVEALDRRADLFVAGAYSGHPALRPLLVEILEEAIPGRDLSAEPIELPSELADALEALRPLQEATIVGALGAVARHKLVEAYPAVLRACRDGRFTIRRAALPAAWPCAPAEDGPRAAAQLALIEALGSADRGLRAIAHDHLKRITKRNLPPSIDAWLACLKEQEAARALVARAREAGYESVEAYLADHPDEAPPPPPAPPPAEPATPPPPDPDLQEPR